MTCPPPHVVFIVANEYDVSVAVAAADLLARREVETVVLEVPKRPTKGKSGVVRAIEKANKTRALLGVYLTRLEGSSPDVRGVSVQYTPGAEGLANLVLRQVVIRLHANSHSVRGVTEGPLLLARMPTISVSPGFITNAADRARLERFPGDYAMALEVGIYKHLHDHLGAL